jgi:uncharacterized protein (TIGR02118 family)
VEKLIFVFARREGMSVAEFRNHYLTEHAASALSRTASLERYVVNLVEENDAGTTEAGIVVAETTVPVDAITEIWTPAVATFLDPETAFVSPEAGEAHMADHDSFIGQMHVYRVEENVVQPTPRGDASGARTPGVKFMSLMYRAEGMSPDDFRTHWSERHTPLAVQHHVGMSGYVQNAVVETLTPNSPPVDGFVEMYFPTIEDFQRRFFDSDEGRDLILADAYTFISSTTVSLTVDEHVFR